MHAVNLRNMLCTDHRTHREEQEEESEEFETLFVNGLTYIEGAHLFIHVHLWVRIYCGYSVELATTVGTAGHSIVETCTVGLCSGPTW